MASKKKLIELDEKTLELLEQQAKLNKRSLKNYIEWSLEIHALRVAEPPKEYKTMIDAIKKRHQEGRIEWHSEEEIKKHYGK